MENSIGPVLPRPMATSPRTTSDANTAEEFEAMFLSQMVDQMMSTVPMGDFGGGHAEEAWRSVMSDAMAEQIAAQGRTGIADSVRGAIEAYRARSGDSA